MAKKRQADFQKTQMKPGRTITKRKNITNVSFKSKKITILNKGPKQNVKGKTIQDCLKAIEGSKSNSDRISAVDDLNKLIDSHRNSLSAYLADVLEAVSYFIWDADNNLRQTASSVLASILKYANDVQIQSFIPHFIYVLQAQMTHPSMKVKAESVSLLTTMIEHHSSLIPHFVVLLDPLINLLVGSPRTRTQSQTSRQNISIIYHDSIYSPSFRIKLIGHINAFLKAALNKSLVMNNDKKEKELYWDSKDPLYLPIYSGSGLKPVDIEKSSKASEEFNDYSSVLIKHLDNMLYMFPILFVEEIPSDVKDDDHLLDALTINNLNGLFDTLITITEWLEVVPLSDVLKDKISQFLMTSVYEKQRFPFKKRLVFKKSEEDFLCVKLNLNVCYLYCTYVLDKVENKQDLYNSIICYMKTLFGVSENVKCELIPVLTKITKFFLGIKGISEKFLTDCLFQLCTLLKVFDNHPNRELLTSLFTKMSLDVAYQFLTETDAMKEWYKWLLNNLSEIPNGGKVDKEILEAIKKIANHRYPCFQELLDKTEFFVIRALLKCDDDVCDATIFLIYNMKDITTDLLDNIASMILTESSFPKRFAVRLIRLLTYRFSEKPLNGEIPEVSIYNSKGLVDIVKFLLNIAIDSFNISKAIFIDYEANSYTKSMKIIKDVFPYSILPSIHWKDHSEIFEVCAKFLNQLPPVIVHNISIKLFQEILDNTNVLPMHVVISILKLNNREMKEQCYYGIQVHDLIFSGLITTSILTCMSIDDEWYECNVTELINSMDLTSRTILETLKPLEVLKDELQGIVVYHILRVFKFLIEKSLLKPKHYEKILETVNILKDKCSDRTISHQPLFISLYNHLSLYM